ncbi:MAG: HTTM domain-containing protein [Bdellovibrionales bacterium]
MEQNKDGLKSLTNALSDLQDFFWRPKDYKWFNYFRVAFAFTVLVNYAHLLIFSPELYGDGDSAILTSQVAKTLHQPWQPPLFLNSLLDVQILLIVGLILLFFLAEGRFARWAAAALFLIQIQIELRNPLILRGSDTLSRLFFLYFVFVPNHCHVRFHHLLSRKKELNPIGPAWPLRLFQIQVAIVYLVAGLSKLEGFAWWKGRAVSKALGSWDFSRFPALGPALPHTVDAGLTWGVLAFEIAFPILIWFCRFRSALIATALVFHLSCLTLMNLPGWHLFMSVNLLLWMNRP